MFYVNTLQKFMQDYVFSPRGKNNTQHMKKHRPDSFFRYINFGDSMTALQIVCTLVLIYIGTNVN